MTPPAPRSPNDDNKAATREFSKVKQLEIARALRRAIWTDRLITIDWARNYCELIGLSWEFVANATDAGQEPP